MFVAFCIPLIWYAIYPSFGIVTSLFSPYLCTQIQTQIDMAKIYVNGDAQEVNLPLNVSELIQQQNVQQPEMVSVQVNEEFAEREDWESQRTGERGVCRARGLGEYSTEGRRQGRFPVFHGRRRIMIEFTEDQIQRYSRHILLQDVGVEGQERIINARVLVVGAGGLGAPVSLYLAAAGIGTIGIVDADVVDLSNLQRQVIHFTKDVGVPKVKSAEEKIKAINPDVKVDTYYEFLDSSNALDIIKEYDFIVDGTDNFPVKFLINDACVMAGKPFSHGGILRFNGQTFTHLPGTACYRCMFKEPPPVGAVPTCSQAGVLGAIAGMLGTIQAAETLKYFTGIGELLTNRLLTFDAKTMQFRTVPVRHRDSCAICGTNPTIDHLIDYEQAACDLKNH